MKRTVSTLVLLVFVLAGAAPCQAAIASCGMKMPAPDVRCGACLTDTGGAPVLKAVSCCRGEPGQDRATAPAVLATPQTGASAPVKAAVAVVPVAAGASAGLVATLKPAPPGAAGPPDLFLQATVLRL
jgi:hypothetical protein